MPSCHSCGAPVTEAAAYCGACGAALREPPAPDDELDTAEQIARRVGALEEREAAGGIGPRAKGAAYALGGVAAVGVGYWLGFVGYTETQLGPQGFGVYQVTYPIPGIVLIVVGLLAVLAGVAGLSGEDI